MVNSSGKCTCGNVQFELSLPEQLETYEPRACDCDFCVNNRLTYLSHPDGTLKIVHVEKFSILKQGSEQASFLKCNVCGDIIGAFALFNNNLKGAVNANLLIDSPNLQAPVPISPKVLSPEEKLKRWDTLWLIVSINGKNQLN